MKKTLFVSAFLGALTLAAAAQAHSPLDYRRTEHLAFAQKNLVFEAPDGMCFLDATDPKEGQLLDAMKAEIAANKKEILMAVFADCGQVGAIDKGAPPSLTLLDVGTIAWLNPYVGETSPMDLPDYLDMRGTTMKSSMKNSMKTLLSGNFGDKPHRTDVSVSLAYSGDVANPDAQLRATGITSATLIRHFPIDITLTHATMGKHSPSLDEAYTEMDQIIAKQVALNTKD